VVGKRKPAQGLLSEEGKIAELRAAHDPGEVTRELYHELARILFPILTYVQKTSHTNLLS
jgi:hypothetical protein